jgi:Type II secretion system (T2SS), protein E, N-terminal domain
MLSPEPANGAFFADPAKAAAPAAQEAQPAAEAVALDTSAIPSPTHESAAGPSAAMIDVPLGTLIFRAGLLGEEQLEDALREGMRTGRRLGEVLIERGLLEERDLGRLLAGQKGLPFVEITASDAEPEALEKLSEDDARHHVALPMRYEGGQLVVAVADPSNELMLENLRRTLGAAPKLVVAPYAELVTAIAEAYARPRPEAAPEPETAVAEPAAPQPEETRPQLEAVPEQEPVVAEPETPLLETQPQPQAEVERAPVRPLPIMLRPNQPAAEPPPATKLPSPPMLPSPVPTPSVEETPEVESPVAEAIETTPASQESAPEPAPEATPEPQAAAVEPTPDPELILELPPDWPSTGEEQAEEPASPAPPTEEPAPEPPAQEEAASLTVVILRLQDGTTLEVGTFPTVAEAAAEAQEVVIEIAAADRNSTWPFFAQRYLRPDLIISVDLIEQGSVNDGLRRSQR